MRGRAPPLPAPPLPGCRALDRAQADILEEALGGQQALRRQALPPAPAPQTPGLTAASLGPPGQPPASSHAAGSSTIDPAPLLWAPACPPGPAPLRLTIPLPLRAPLLPSPGAQSLWRRTSQEGSRLKRPSKRTLGGRLSPSRHSGQLLLLRTAHPAYPRKRRCCSLNFACDPRWGGGAVSLHVVGVGGEEA